MAEGEAQAGDGKKKGGALGLIIGLALAIVLGGASFYAVYADLVALPLPEKTAGGDHGGDGGAQAAGHGGGHGEGGEDLGSVMDRAALSGGSSYVPLEPIMVTIGRPADPRHLQFAAQLEVDAGVTADATMMTPRAVDVLHTYLRAVDPADVEDPAAMLRMRAQMLRRIQVVMGEGVVRDLLISEFILR